ncbi:MAG: hypothetical protein JWQ19_2993 [Subtercola sp.]|nr:hypothetical protein [Subtercola sp.]
MKTITDFEVAIPHDAELGEAPSWDPAGALLWVDMWRNQILRTDLTTGHTDAQVLPEPAGSIVPAQSGGYLFTDPSGFWHLPDFGAEPRLVAAVESEMPETRMNDGKCDPLGRMWSGSMYCKAAEGVGSLYRLDHDGVATEAVAGTRIPNGLAFSPDARTLYFIDTALKTVDVIRLDGDGTPVSRELLIDVSPFAGIPDGMTIDDDGCLWIAFAQSSQLRRITPSGKLDTIVELPVPYVMSVAFGGEGLRTLFVTTARGPLSAEQRAEQPLAGSVLAVHPASHGVPETPFGGALG